MRKLLRKLRETATCEVEEREEEQEINQMMNQVEYGKGINPRKSGYSLTTKQVTICQEFNLTKPKVKKIRFIQKVNKSNFFDFWLC